MSKRSADNKKKREAGRSSRNGTSETTKATEFLHSAQHQHDHFLKAIFEQQKLAQQQEFEHQQKLQHEHKVRTTHRDTLRSDRVVSVQRSIRFIDWNAFQEQERKRQELAYLKQLELKKRHDEKLLLLEQRTAEKDAQREKKIVRFSLSRTFIKTSRSLIFLAREIHWNRARQRIKTNRRRHATTRFESKREHSPRSWFESFRLAATGLDISG